MSYEAKRLLNLAEEPGLDHATAASENKMTVVTESTWKSSNPANPANPPSAPITRSNSDVSLYMPVRRRSVIQTPGVATRSSSTRDPPPLPQPSFRYSHPASPNLSRQQSFESYRSGIVSMPPSLISDIDAVPRVVTPCDEHYRSIGTFKLGSLRITNGCPSPATPEVLRSREVRGLGLGDAIAQDGYFPEGEHRETRVTTADAMQLPTQSHRFGPLLSPSPLQPTSLALQTTPEITAMEDQEFEEETQPEYSSVEILDVRLDPNAKSPHSHVERDTGTTVTRTDSGFESTTSPSSEASHKPLTKADSGYSSNVSLRSFHAKPVPEKDGSPPPVPPKDHTLRSSTSRPKPSVIVAQKTPMSNLTEGGRARTLKTTRHVPIPPASHPSGDRSPISPVSMGRTPGGVSSPRSDNSNPTLSIGNGSQKPSRLQRLLSFGGARRSTAGPPPVYTTHPLDQSSIPPVPKGVEYKLHERTKLFSGPSKRLALRPRSSLDTLKTNFGVGSIDASPDAVDSIQAGPTLSEPKPNEAYWRQTLQSMPASIANAAAHVIPRKSTTRSPVTARQEAVQGSGHMAGRSREPGGRTMSLTLPGKRGTYVNYRASGRDRADLATEVPVSPLPSPVAKAISAESRGKKVQPASTTTRRTLSLRVPPLLQPQFGASVGGTASRESPARETGRDSFHTYSPSTTADDPISPSKITMDPRRLKSFRQFHDPQSSPYNSPNLELKMNHDTMAHRASQGVPAGSSRRNSISSAQSECVYGAQRPDSAQGWQVRPGPPPLRHRASYDDFSLQQRHSQHGRPPSMSNGYGVPSKPASDPQSRGQLDTGVTWSRSQFGAAAGQWYQDGFVRPYGPQGHHRTRSIGNRNAPGPNPPYRVLHSYNSPAYRHAPIWG